MKNKVISMMIILVILINVLSISKATNVISENNTIENLENDIQVLSDDENSQETMEVAETVEDEESELVNIEIINLDKEIRTPITGSEFLILNYEYVDLKQFKPDLGQLITDESGKINVELEKGMYYIKQKTAVEGYILNKGIVELDINNTDNATITIDAFKQKEPEVVTNNIKEINVEEETKDVVENNTKEVTNIKSTNLNKEIINTTNETNWSMENEFINTLEKNNVVNLNKKDTYNNLNTEETITNKTLQGYDNIELRLSQQDYINQVYWTMYNSTRVPNLPVASK